MNLEALIFWLQDSSPGVALRESIYVYPAIATVHVLAVSIFCGTIFLFDLRLLGLALQKMAPPELWQKLVATVVTAFLVAAISGGLLFWANPVRNFHSLWFRIKLVGLLVAAINGFYFHRFSQKQPRATALISLLVWIAVLACGRLIAYNWFDCGRAEAYPWLLWLSGCEG